MRSTLRATVATALALAAALVAPASAAHGGPHPSFATQRVYFTCPGPIANAGGWSTVAPGSVQQRKGCGNLVEPMENFARAHLCRELGVCPQQIDASSNDGSTTYEGTFSGNLRDLTIELHRFPDLPGSSGTGPAIGLWVDGQRVGLLWRSISGTSAGLTKRFEISVPALGCAREVLDADGRVTDVAIDGFATEDGQGSQRRLMTLRVESDLWMWGAAEFAAGITFNPPTLSPGQHLLRPEHRANCEAT